MEKYSNLMPADVSAIVADSTGSEACILGLLGALSLILQAAQIGLTDDQFDFWSDLWE